MDATRHSLAREGFASSDLADVAASVKLSEDSGNWYLAGERYRELAASVSDSVSIEDRARMLARAAACFEIANQARPAARAYFDAATILHNSGLRFQTAGELFNRSAHLFRTLGEYFNAGDSWRRAGKAFLDMPVGSVKSRDNILPVPAAAGNRTIAGNCYVAAGDAFTLAGDNAKWACMAFWEGGRAHAGQGYGFPAFEAYRKALVAGIRFYGTHDRDELRRYLPLTNEERAEKIDPVQIMEDAARSGNEAHQRMNAGILAPSWTEVTTNRQLAAAFHEFHLACVAVGNTREAAQYRAETKERQRRVFISTGRWGIAALYWLWKGVAGYGESVTRWVVSCMAVLFGFSILYSVPSVISPCTDWWDPLYFSVVTFTTLGYGDIRPVGLLGKLLAAFESMLGLVMFGLLLSFIGNRVQRFGPSK